MLTFLKVFTCNFLFYSWNDLKNNKNRVSCFSGKKVLRPISKYWFEKVSLLIRSGKFVYKNNKNFNINCMNSKRQFLVNIKNNILENSFILLLEPYFSDAFFSNSFNLTDSVRFVFKILIS